MTGRATVARGEAWPVARTPMPTCGCSYEWKNYGYLHGVNMGDGWVRMDTAPGCTEHSGEGDR